MTTTVAALTPVRARGRALAPDLARGAMLLFIALANATGVVFGGELSSERHPHGLERITNVLLYVTVHARAYPMFAVLFGYSLIQLARRQSAAGLDDRAVRRILLRRNAWLIAFGAVHAVLLYSGDFLGAYGIVGMVCALFLVRSRRLDRLDYVLWAISAVEVLVIGVLVVVRLVAGSGAPAALKAEPVHSLLATNPLTALADRVAEWPVHTAIVLPFIMIVWLGIIAAKRGILERPAEHRRLLAWAAGVCLGVAFLGGLPLGLVAGGYLHADAPTIALMTQLQGGSGMFGGPGYIALFGLLAAWLSNRERTPVASALAALGRRSLSGYLFQSVAWLVLLTPYTLNLRFGSPLWTGLAVAFLVWLVSVAGAVWLGDRPGPAEKLLRRLTYRTSR
jgi:uncharacterized membrane protein YeiB